MTIIYFIIITVSVLTVLLFITVFMNYAETNGMTPHEYKEFVINNFNGMMQFRKQRTLLSLQKWMKLRRNFNAKTYLRKKTETINSFFKANNLDAACIGISGGIDSALVLALLRHAANQKGSPIKRISALIMPIQGNGTSNQTASTDNALLVCRSMADEWNKESGLEYPIYYDVCNLTKPFGEYKAQRETFLVYAEKAGTPIVDLDWAAGQLASIVRTPFLYYGAALLQTQGYKSIVVGTTNKDEGDYIGFFGKASDGMVDLQPIADLFKSEVREVAKLLNVPDQIVNAVPTGDVFDGKTDEEMIGSPYWFLEMYQMLKTADLVDLCKKKLNDEDKKIFEAYAENIESLHAKNAHKYHVGSPAHYINI